MLYGKERAVQLDLFVRDTCVWDFCESISLSGRSSCSDA